MLNKFLTFFLYEEKHHYIKNNVLVVFQICMMMWFTTAFHAYQGNYSQVLRDSILLGLIMLMWFFIKKYNKYYPYVTAIVLVPMIILSIAQGLFEGDVVELYWIYPACLLFFLVFPLRLALVSSILTVALTVAFSYNLLPAVMIINAVVSSLALVTGCTFAFKNMYKQYDNLENKANRDPLTNLYNRSLLSDLLNHSIKNKNNLIENKKSIFPPIIFCLDVDHFKQVNDTYGHQVGDDVLLGFTSLLQKTFNRGEKIFRMGGEEFLVLVENRSAHNALKLAEEFRELTEKTKLLPNGKNITVSIGISIHQEDESWNYWLKRADDAMYHAKQNGRNQVMINS